MPPETLGDKFCKLDINMIVNGQRVDLEIQVANEGNYPERCLYMWAREFSTALKEKEDFSTLPRTIIISIMAFDLFKDTAEFHSEFGALEVKRHTPLSDKFCLHFFELKKLPKVIEKNESKELWLLLFRAETENDLAKIEALEVPVMAEMVQAYRKVSASDEFKEKERMRSKARHDEAQALLQRDLHWQSVVDSVVAEREATLADKDALIAQLRAQLGK